MKKLILAASCLFVPSIGATQNVQAEVTAVKTAPSAHQGLVLALGLLKDAAPSGKFDVLRIHSEVVHATDTKPATASVSIDLRMHGEGGAAAEKAFQKVEADIGQRLKALAPKEFAYGQAVAALIDPVLRAPEPEAGVASGTHRGTLQVVLPANLVGKALPVEAKSDSGETGRVSEYIRAVAGHKHIKFGALKIRPQAGEAGKTFDIGLGESSKASKPATRLRTQVANFLYKLEEGTGHLVISKVSFDLNSDSQAENILIQTLGI